MDSIEQSDNYVYDQSVNKLVKKTGTISAVGEGHIESPLDQKNKPFQSVDAIGGAEVNGQSPTIEHKSQITEESMIAKVVGSISKESNAPNRKQSMNQDQSETQQNNMATNSS